MLIHKFNQVSKFDRIGESIVIPTVVYNDEVFFKFSQTPFISHEHAIFKIVFDFLIKLALRL